MNTLKKLICITSLLTISACASRKEMRNFQMDTLYLRMQVDSLRVEQLRQKALLANHHESTELNSEIWTKKVADFEVQLGQIFTQMEFLNERLEETNRYIASLSAKVPLAEKASFHLGVDAALRETVKIQQDTLKSNIAYQFPGSVRLYDLSYQDLTKGYYELAREGFLQYLRLLPDGELADDSQYWIGESYFAEKKFPEAAKSFELLLTNYSESDRTPPALLKLAYCQIELGKAKTGREKLALLIKQFPQSNEARLAQEKLDEKY